MGGEEAPSHERGIVNIDNQRPAKTTLQSAGPVKSGVIIWTERTDMQISEIQDALRDLARQYDHVAAAGRPATVIMTAGERDALTAVMHELGSDCRTSLPYPVSLLHDMGLMPEKVAIPRQTAAMQAVLSHLPKNESRALTLYYRDMLSRDEIASDIGVSPIYADILIEKGLEHLKEPHIRKILDAAGQPVPTESAPARPANRRLFAGKKAEAEYPNDSDELYIFKPVTGRFSPDASVKSLGLPNLIINALYRADIKVLADLQGMPVLTLKHIHRIGPKSFDALKSALSEAGLEPSPLQD